MNDYQDQATWYEVQTRDPYSRWVTVDDADTREEALDRAFPGDRVVRRRGLTA
jgi:hypothetical protein